MLFSCYKTSDVKNYLEDLELFSASFAALAHDINHKGVNNQYKINKRSRVALTYCDNSVLENMHASTYMKILRNNPEFDVT